MPDVSIVIPAFRPQGFEALYKSMAANADVDAEWIVVDDGSGAQYDAVFGALKGADVRVTRQSENRRQGAARNVGLAQARAALVKFLDADDALDEGHLAALLSRAHKGDAIPFAPTKHLFAGGGSLVNDSWRDLPQTSEAQYTRLLHRPFLHHCGALFRRDVLRDIGGYDEDLLTDEDGDLMLRLLRAGHHFAPVEGVHYVYIHHDSGARVSADDDLNKLHARLRVCDKVEASFGGNMPAPVRAALAQRLDKLAMTYFAVAPTEAKAILKRAQTLCPGYVPDMRAPLRIVRRLGGPGAVLAVTGLYRRLKGRPKGGSQG